MHDSAMTYVALGGTFDPVHRGHIQSAQALISDIGYERVHLIPCGDAYHKDQVSSGHHRQAMLELALKDFPNLILDARELQRQGATYTVDTLKQLRMELGPDAHVCWVMGTDAAAGVTKWHQWQLLFELANVIVMRRAGEPEPTLNWPAQFTDDVSYFKQQAYGYYLQVTLPQIILSSSDIRRDVSQGLSVIDHVSPAVNDYIQQHGLYRGNN